MTTLEITLGTGCVIFAWLWASSIRKRMIVRHLFIQFTDWSALKIDEMTEAANWQAIEADRQLAQCSGRDPSERRAIGAVAHDITAAKGQWQSRIDNLQTRLSRNGMRPLDLDDKDIPILSPWVSGIKL